MQANQKLKKSITIDNTWMYILSALSKEPMHAYGLRARIKEMFKWEPELITLYIVIYRIEAEGLIKGVTDGRKRNYVITEQGRKALREAKRLLKKTADVL